MQRTPASLLEQLRRPGEGDAWPRFVRLYTPLLFHWAHHLGLRDADAADLVQDVLTALVQKLPTFAYDPGRSFRSWLRAVTFNRWRDGRGRPPAQPLVDDVAVADPAESFWEQDYRRHLVGRAFDVMRAEFQPATWRACWESVVAGRPAAEVAAELGISENAVYLAKGRVLRRLRERLAGLLD